MTKHNYQSQECTYITQNKCLQIRNFNSSNEVWLWLLLLYFIWNTVIILFNPNYNQKTSPNIHHLTRTGQYCPFHNGTLRNVNLRKNLKEPCLMVWLTLHLGKERFNVAGVISFAQWHRSVIPLEDEAEDGKYQGTLGNILRICPSKVKLLNVHILSGILNIL